MSTPILTESVSVEESNKAKRRTKRSNFGMEPKRLQLSNKRAKFAHKGHRLAVAAPQFAKFDPSPSMKQRLVDRKVEPEDIVSIQDFINSHFKS